MGENLLWLQNHFLEKNFLPNIFTKIFLVEFFYDSKIENSFTLKIFLNTFSSEIYCYKIISLKTGSNQKFSSQMIVRKFFMAGKSIPRKQVCFQNFHQKYFGPKFFNCKIISTKKIRTKNFHQLFLVEYFLLLHNHFLENRFQPKIFIKNFLVEIFLFLQNHFLENRFVPKIFINNFLVGKFLWFQNHFLENRFLPKFVSNFLA